MTYIPTILTGFYYSSNMDRSANDHTIYVESNSQGDYVLGVRYKNSERSTLYEIELNADDLIIFGQMLINAGQTAQTINGRGWKDVESTDD